MTRLKKQAKCHPERPNYNRGRCAECEGMWNDPEVPCPHLHRKRDAAGRCSSCMSHYYKLRRSRGEGDRFGTVRSSRTLRHIEDPILRNKLVARKNRLGKYSLSLEDYDQMFEKQGDVCAICKQASPRDLNVDHDHDCCPGTSSCGKCVRALLCHGCNIRLGHLESPLALRSVSYLNSFGKELPWIT